MWEHLSLQGHLTIKNQHSSHVFKYWRMAQAWRETSHTADSHVSSTQHLMKQNQRDAFRVARSWRWGRVVKRCIAWWTEWWRLRGETASPTSRCKSLTAGTTCIPRRSLLRSSGEGKTKKKPKSVKLNSLLAAALPFLFFPPLPGRATFSFTLFPPCRLPVWACATRSAERRSEFIAWKLFPLRLSVRSNPRATWVLTSRVRHMACCVWCTCVMFEWCVCVCRVSRNKPVCSFGWMSFLFSSF